MPVDYEARYRRAIAIVYQAEREILRLRKELAAQKEVNVSLAIVAEEALSALEALSANHQA
jgi:hypothetical protein